MAARKTYEEQLEEIKVRQDQLKAREKAVKARQRADNRRKEAHRKIVIGAAVESVLGRPIQEDEISKLIDFLKDQERRGKWFSKAMNKQRPSEDQEEAFGTRMDIDEHQQRKFGNRTKHNID